MVVGSPHLMLSRASLSSLTKPTATRLLPGSRSLTCYNFAFGGHAAGPREQNVQATLTACSALDAVEVPCNTRGNSQEVVMGAHNPPGIMGFGDQQWSLLVG